MDFNQLAFDKAPVGLVLAENRIIRACNSTFAEMLGYLPSELIGQSFRMLYASREEFDRVRDIGLEPLKTDGFYVDERMLRHCDGTMMWCGFRAQTLDLERPLARIVMSFARLSEGRQTQLSLRERQVLSGLGRGLTSKEIARELELSPRTIEDVRARLLKRFGVRNATELLARISRLEP